MAIAPRIIVALGATAAQALFGRAFRVTWDRGRLMPSALATHTLATVHPLITFVRSRRGIGRTRNPQIRRGFPQGRGDGDMIGRGPKGSTVTWIAATVAVAAVLAVAVVSGEFWSETGDSDISEAGWFAMGLGIFVTSVLGIGLMSLVFFSNRRGYDEAGRRDS